MARSCQSSSELISRTGLEQINGTKLIIDFNHYYIGYCEAATKFKQTTSWGKIDEGTEIIKAVTRRVLKKCRFL